MPTKTTPTPVETDHADRPADLDARIADLNEEWTRYRNVQPVAPGGLAGAVTDPTRLLRKYELGVAIDRFSVEREEARADQARATLAALAGVDTDPLAAASRSTLERVLAARSALAAAEAEHRTAVHAARRHLDRVRETEDRLRQAEDAAARWRTELERDQAILATLPARAIAS